jgi:hypothetical protein
MWLKSIAANDEAQFLLIVALIVNRVTKYPDNALIFCQIKRLPVPFILDVNNLPEFVILCEENELVDLRSLDLASDFPDLC